MQQSTRKQAVAYGELQNLVVDDQGRLYIYKYNKALKGLVLVEKNPYKPSGRERYYTTNIKKKSKNCKAHIHRIVAETFLGPATDDSNWLKLLPECFSEKQWMSFSKEQREFMSHGIHIDHINGEGFDNRAENLQYLWAKDNIKKGNTPQLELDFNRK